MNTLKIILTVYFLALSAKSGNSENTIEHFVYSKMQSYESWVKGEGLDPSPSVPGPTYIESTSSFARLDCYLSDHLVKDYSGNINITSIKADLDRISMSFTIQQNVTFSGKYVANGTVGWTSEEVKADGTWFITLPQVILHDLHFNYTILSNGYVDITDYNFNGVDIPSYWYDEEDGQVYFENLWEEEYVAEFKEYIQKGLYAGYRKYLIDDVEHPLKRVLLQYFQQIFSSVTWAEIVLPGLPPCMDS